MHSTTTVLREILLEGKAHTQEEIRQALESQNITISQPKVSRLLHQLGAVKLIDNKGKTQYRLPHEMGLIHELTTTQEKIVLRQWILDVVFNETLIIIHTTPGAAGMVARILDQHRMSLKLLGTIAGDDTIFISPQSHKAIPVIVEQINKLFKL